MSKEFNTQEQSNVNTETASDNVYILDDISLALIGGGELPVAL
jgi:hypothetical protein